MYLKTLTSVVALLFLTLVTGCSTTLKSRKTASDARTPQTLPYRVSNTGKINPARGVNNSVTAIPNFRWDGTMFNGVTIPARDITIESDHVYIQDKASFYDSASMHTAMLFFPKKNATAVELTAKDLAHVTIPTGETFDIDPTTGEIISGILTEGVIDLYNGKSVLPSPLVFPDASLFDEKSKYQAYLDVLENLDVKTLYPYRHKRSFAKITYKGAGIVIVSESRGQHPFLIPSFGPNQAIIYNFSLGLKCVVQRQNLWTQGNEEGSASSAQFRYKTDDEFNSFLKANCKFSLY